MLKAAVESEQLPKVALEPEQLLMVAGCWEQHRSEIARPSRPAACWWEEQELGRSRR